MDTDGHRDVRRTRQNSRPRLVFEQLNPWVIFTYYVVVIASSMVFLHPIFLIVEFLLVIAVDLLSGGKKQVVMMVEGSIFMVAFIMVINPLVNSRGAHVIWQFGGMLITVEAVVYGMLMALSLMIVLLIFISYNKCLTSQKFMYLFSRISPKLTLLTMITLRFVPLFLRRFKGITQAQSLRGIEVGHGNFRQRSIGVMRLMEVLLVSSFNNALQTADSMSSRGYASSKRTSFQRYRFTQRDILTLCWYLPLTIACFYAASKGIGRLTVYPALGTIALNGQGLLVLLGVMLLVGFPLILEAWEWLWWNLLKL